MAPPSLWTKPYLPRLEAGFYHSDAIVFWTHTVEGRGQGWLSPEFHHRFRELMLHLAVRENLLTPIYTLMPDHLHLIWMGLAVESDQLRGTAFLPQHLGLFLAPHRLQHQAFDRVLRERDRERGAFAAVCAYIAANPVRGALTSKAEDWPYTGCIVPGYPRLGPLEARFWEIFWPIYSRGRGQGGLGRRQLAV